MIRGARGVVVWSVGLLLAVLTALPGLAAGPLPPEWEERVVDYVENEMATLGMPGVSVAIVHDSQVVFAKGFGVADPGGRPVNAETPFRIASVSKSLTALAVMQLVEAGALELDDTLASLIPDLVVEDTEAITVRNLLTHTSGWAERDGLMVDSGPSKDALRRNARRIARTPLDHPVGEFEYSNTNYDVLGFLIERILGESFGDYMAEHVFDPLQMTHTFTSEEEAEAEGLATGNYPYFGLVRPLRAGFLSGRVPSGGIMASAEDLSHALISHLNEGRYRDIRVLSPEGTRLLHQPASYESDPCCGYAMGLNVFPLYSADRLVADEGGFSRYEVPVVLEHTGAGPSSSSGIIMLPEQKIGVVVLSNINDESVPSLYHQMHIGIAHILLDIPPRPTVAFEGLLARNGKLLSLVLVIAFSLRASLSAARVRRLIRGSPKPILTTTAALRKLVIPLAVDVVLVGMAWWLFLSEADAPFASVRRAVPDIFTAFVAATVIAVGWAVARTIITFRALRAKKNS